MDEPYDPDNGYGVTPSAVITATLRPRSVGMGGVESPADTYTPEGQAVLILAALRDAGFKITALAGRQMPTFDALCQIVDRLSAENEELRAAAKT